MNNLSKDAVGFSHLVLTKKQRKMHTRELFDEQGITLCTIEAFRVDQRQKKMSEYYRRLLEKQSCCGRLDTRYGRSRFLLLTQSDIVMASHV